MKSLFLLLLLAHSAVAATYLVRDGGDGSSPTTSWAGAYDQISSAEAAASRGDTIYVSDGNYTGLTIDIANSGTSRVIFKKATVADHGVATGWDNAYGDGQAVLSSGIVFEVGYITIDGQTEYGFRIDIGEGGRGISQNGTSLANLSGHIWQYIQFEGPAGTTDYFWTDQTVGIYSAPFTAYSEDVLISHVSIRGFETLMLTAQTRRWILEHSVLSYSRTSNGDPQSPHPNVWYNQLSEDLVIRYNDFSHWENTGIYLVGACDNLKAYGNYFHDPENVFPWSFHPTSFGGSGVFQCFIYNNTFDYGSVEFGIVDFDQDDANTTVTGDVRNNIFKGSAFYCTYDDATHDYNWFEGADKDGETNGIAAGSTNPFTVAPVISETVSSTLPRNKGQALASEYNTDADGNVRGADGTWDMGAYEFSSGGGGGATIQTLNVQNLTITGP